MDKYIVTYDLALKLKEIGFNDPCYVCYYTHGMKETIHDPTRNELFQCHNYNRNAKEDQASAPLYDQVLSWFRDKDYYLVVDVLKDLKGTFSFTILQKESVSTIGVQEIYTAWYIESYEEARNKGIEWIINHIKENGQR